MPFIRSITTLTVALVLLLVLAACGGDEPAATVQRAGVQHGSHLAARWAQTRPFPLPRRTDYA